MVAEASRSSRSWTLIDCWPFSASLSCHDAIAQGAIHGAIFGGFFPLWVTDKRRRYRKGATAQSLGQTQYRSKGCSGQISDGPKTCLAICMAYLMTCRLPRFRNCLISTLYTIVKVWGILSDSRWPPGHPAKTQEMMLTKGRLSSNPSRRITPNGYCLIVRKIWPYQRDFLVGLSTAPMVAAGLKRGTRPARRGMIGSRVGPTLT